MMACGLLVVGQLYATIPLTPWIEARYGLDAPTAALAGSAFGVTYAASFLACGPLSDRLGRGRVILAGLVLLSAATVLAGPAPGFPSLLAARALQGVFAATLPPAAVSLVVETLPEERRPFGIAAMAFSFLASAPVAQLVVADVAEHGLPPVMLGAAPLLLAAALLLAATLGRAGLGRPAPVSGARAASPARDPIIVACWVCAPMLMFAFVAFQAGVQILGPSLPIGPATLRLLAVPALAAGFLAVPLAGRIGAPGTAITGFAMVAAGLALTLEGGWGGLGGGAALATAGVGIGVTGLIMTISGRAATPRRGLAVAVYTCTLFLGASLAPPAAASLAPGGPLPLLGVPAAVALAGAALLLAARRLFR
ncbi:MFS transporter [Roseomonas nepalensis]|uniref:MFS transporter n=1 Tax=Muricoccus nepalensis TaxID=1854500 RepID=A0A502FUT1_9PROT|nr:MFS transporter [Roseomonas nepalensis]TPG53150.1 MFS transporter [Roseomonas nepalensis]